MRALRSMRVRARWVWRGLTALAVAIQVGCYTYTETSLETLSPGIQTRVQLDEDGFGRVVNQAASNGVPVENLDLGGRAVSGRLMSLDPTNLRVEMRGVGGSVFAADIPMAAVQGFGVRTFSPQRTVLAVGLGAALAGAIYTGTVGGTTNSGGDDGELNARIPFFSIPLR